MNRIETAAQLASDAGTEQKVPAVLATKDAADQLIKATRKVMKADGPKDL